MDYAFDPGRPPSGVPRECLMCIGVTNGLVLAPALMAVAITIFEGMRDGNIASRVFVGGVLFICSAAAFLGTIYVVVSIAKDCFKKKSYVELPDHTAQKV